MFENLCPDPLCILDMTPPIPCFTNCPHKPIPHPTWGGKRAGAGAPEANLNAIKHGHNSKLIQTAVNKLAADPTLRAFLFLIARAAGDGDLPQTTKALIIKATTRGKP